MDKLTTEQKAKRYDEALEAVKILQEVNPSDEGIQNWVNENFPELVESEDERIRKNLIELFQDTVSNDEVFRDYGLDKTEVIAWLEKQGEQKPAEWSEEDYCNLNEIMSYIKDNDLKVWLKSLKPQPKQEWSQNDIDMIDWLIRCCEKEHEELCNDKYGHQDIVYDLKRDCRKKWDWLESLKNRVAHQKQWKPTEEQIKALKDACDEHWEPDGLDPLYTLWEQLSKLMEE